MTTDTLLPLHRIAVENSVGIVNRVTRADLGRPTPCAGWTLRDLLAHMTAQHRGFAAAARGAGVDFATWDPAAVVIEVDDDPAGTYRAAAAGVLAAFAGYGVLDTSFALAESGGRFIEVPGAQAIGFHLVDYVVHGWDVARTLGSPFDIPAPVVNAAAPIAFAVPDADFRTAEGSPFAPALAPAGDGGELDLMLRHLGRSPDWTP